MKRIKFLLENLGEKYLKEPFIHAYANLHSIHTNKQKEANIETHALSWLKPRERVVSVRRRPLMGDFCSTKASDY